MPDPDPLDAGTSDELPGPLYELQLGPNACDICEELSGTYPVAPAVPLHTGCRCTVADAGAGGSGHTSGDCTTEIRGLEWETAGYTESETLVDDTCGQEAGFVEVVPHGDPPLEEFDEGVEAAAVAAGWVKPDLSEIQSIGLGMEADADQHVELVVTRTFEDTIFRGELWRVCVRSDPVAGTAVTEEQIGSVGGFYGGMIQMEIGEMTFQPCTDVDYERYEGYFDDDAEFPQGTSPA